MLKRINETFDTSGACIKIGEMSFPSPFKSGLEYSPPVRGSWNIVHTGMLIPEAHEIFVCAASCLRGVVLTAAEMGAMDRFSTVEIKDNNLLNGDLEQLAIEGVTDILNKLSKMPPAVLVYTSCIHHFAGCDLEMIYSVLKSRFPNVDFTDCYMNPIMRKSGLTPDQLMRRQLYSLLDKEKKNPKSVAIIGNDLETDKESELVKIIKNSGHNFYEIHSCKSYSQYKKMAECSLWITNYPSARAGGDALEKRIGGKHIYLPFSFDYDEIEKNFAILCNELGIEKPDFKDKKAECENMLKKAYTLIGKTPVAIDGIGFTRPLGLAKLLLEHGFNVTRIYADSFSAEEKSAYQILKNNYPEIEVYDVIHTKMRFMAERESSDFLAIGQKAAYFTGTENFVNIVENGGLYGYEGIAKLCSLMEDAYLNKKDMHPLVEIKGMGCECCL